MGFATRHTHHTLDPYPPLPLPFVHGYGYARVRVRVRFFYSRVTRVIHYSYVGFTKPLTHAHQNPYLWAWVWVFAGMGAGCPGKPQGSP